MILIIDTETTGREPPEVIELAIGGVEEGSWELAPVEVERHSSKLGSCFGALATHHILNEEVSDFSLYKPIDFLGTVYLIGHNIDYDWAALGSPPCKRICTLAMSRKLWPEVDSHSLGAMTYFINEDKAAAREKLRGAHGTEVDVRLCHELLLALLKSHRQPFDIDTAERLWTFSEVCRVPDVWSFGKFKGQPIAAADRGYLMWCTRQPDMDPYVLKAVREALR